MALKAPKIFLAGQNSRRKNLVGFLKTVRKNLMTITSDEICPPKFIQGEILPPPPPVTPWSDCNKLFYFYLSNLNFHVGLHFLVHFRWSDKDLSGPRQSWECNGIPHLTRCLSPGNHFLYIFWHL